MKIKLQKGIIITIFVLMITGCTQNNNEHTRGETFESGNYNPNNTQESEIEMIPVNITINDINFTAQFYENETALAVIDQMPITLEMSDLNNNEKYYNFSGNLPVESTERPETIHAGEIMCWSSNTLVLFYETFSNAYGGYVRLGTIEDITGLSSALGTDNVSVTFTVAQ